ncbi:helix-turn-helix domain-containing protein [Derxia gummosa]|uniref:Helix-turn-helix domain-containing protein n=1 Tax=Derxia gummosa DSM 723 TaxID=1121388 RepID=A0A8B6X8D7_9BURK|nr:helix-turn-helix domain-containing protein [Derxia gummosa]
MRLDENPKPASPPARTPAAVTRSVPNFALYGDAADPDWQGLVQFERITERSSAFNWEIKPHLHDSLIQVLYVSSGGGEAFIDDRKWPVRPGTLIVAPARSVHGFHFTPEVDGPVVTAAQRPLENMAAAAAPELLDTLRRPAVIAVHEPSRHADALMPLFDAIARETQVHARGQVAAGMALMTALFVQIARLGALAPDGGGVRTRKAAQIEQFRALVDARFRERRGVDSYATELGVTAGQLTRLCRELLGMSSLDVINGRVVHEAQRELIYSSLSVKQIAALLGFDDEAYFGRFFRKQTGMRPTEFRLHARRRLAEEAARGEG